MATSPIYNWPEPDNTDLVKNGALAMRTLGDAIDTTMATMTPKSIVDAKGDLIAASAADTPARLAVGANGETLVADSSTSTGLRWQGSTAAGRNFLINGGCDIWQRNTSASFGAFDPAFKTADRWYFFVATANNTLSQETTTLPAGARYGLKWTSGGAGGTVDFTQVIETANTIPLAGKTVTLSAQVTGTTGKTASLRLFSSTGVDTTGTSVSTLIATGSAVTLTSGTYSTVTLTVAVPSNVKTLKFSLRSSDTFANTEYMTFTNAQLEIGSVATSFSRAGSTIAGELALCQRYFAKSYAQATAPATNSSANGLVFAQSGATVASAAYFANVPLPVTMRANPTVTIYSFTSSQTARVSDGAGTDLAANSGATNLINDSRFTVQNNSGGALTAATGGFVFHYTVSAEL